MSNHNQQHAVSFEPSHPCHFLLPLLEDEGLSFLLSAYKHIPDSTDDTRRFITIPGGSGVLTRIQTACSSAEPGENIAIHSIVKASGLQPERELHIPMLDLACQSADDFSIERLRLFLPASVLSKAAIFRSGSSFHFYSTELLTGSEWIRFLGLALLANPVNAPAIVDPRWVGHRLAGGFGGLRITDNKTNPMHITPRLEPGTI